MKNYIISMGYVICGYVLSTVLIQLHANSNQWASMLLMTTSLIFLTTFNTKN